MPGVDCTVRFILEAVVSSRSTEHLVFPKITRTTSGDESMLVRTKGNRMKTYEFDIIADDQADALFAVGCDDGTPASCNGQAWIHFDREAASLEDAIRTALAQVQSAGLRVAKIELDANEALT
jgi:hypothetical protein